MGSSSDKGKAVNDCVDALFRNRSLVVQVHDSELLTPVGRDYPGVLVELVMAYKNRRYSSRRVQYSRSASLAAKI